MHSTSSAATALSPTTLPPPLPGLRRDGAHDRVFVHLLQAYRSHGGLGRRGEVLNSGLWRERVEADGLQPLGFFWGGSDWLPLFQFDPRQGGLRAVCVEVLAELNPVFGAWQLAQWFVEPSLWLDGARPLDLIGSAPARVHAAARADRYVARG